MNALSPPIVQLPSTLWVPPRLGSYGPEIIGFCDDIGLAMDAEQRRDIDCLASFGRAGRWLTFESAMIEGRQNGKTMNIILPIVMADLFLFGEDEPDKIFWTSHLMKTTKQVFSRVQKYIDENSVLSGMVKEVITRPSEESVVLMNGSSLDFIARVSGGGRGMSGKRVVYDEALFLTEEHIGTTMPTLRSRDNPQVMYGSSAGKGQSAHLRSLQARGRRGGDPSLILIEYRAPGGWDEPGCNRGIACTHLVGESGCSLDNEDFWRAGNHALFNGRMRIEFLRAERRTLGQTLEGVLEFGREALGWEELGGESLDPDRIPRAAWTRATDPLSEAVGPVCFAIDMAPSGNSVAISVAGRRADGAVHFGVVDYRQGPPGWAIPRLRQLQAKHETFCPPLWQPEAPVGALRGDVEGRNTNFGTLDMTAVTGAEMAKFCGAFKAHLTADPPTAYHRGASVDETAFASAERLVTSQGAWVWGRRKNGSDICPTVADTLAVGGVDTYGDFEPGVWSF